MRVTETCAEINLQDLLDHTSARLCMYLDEVLDSLNEEEISFLELLSKWGCDGSQQQQFKQKFGNTIDMILQYFRVHLCPYDCFAILVIKIRLFGKTQYHLQQDTADPYESVLFTKQKTSPMKKCPT